MCLVYRLAMEVVLIMKAFPLNTKGFRGKMFMRNEWPDLDHVGVLRQCVRFFCSLYIRHVFASGAQYQFVN